MITNVNAKFDKFALKFQPLVNLSNKTFQKKTVAFRNYHISASVWKSIRAAINVILKNQKETFIIL